MNSYPRFLLVFLAYMAVSILFTFPLVLHIADSLPGLLEMDSFVYMWNIDTFWNRVLTFHNPFITNRVFYPIGVNLVFHTYGVLPSILGVFFLNNLVLYMNLLIVTGLTLSALACFILVRYLTDDSTIAFVSGLIYGFSPIMISYVLSQHYYFVVAAPFLPLGLLMVFRFFDSLKTRYLVYTLLLFWMVFFTDYYTTILFILILSMATVVLIFQSYLRRRELFYRIFEKGRLTGYVTTVLLTLVLPLVLMFVFVFPLGELKTRAFGSQVYYSGFCNTNLVGFLIPSGFNPLLKGFSSSLKALFGLGKGYQGGAFFDTPSYFLGWGILVIAVISFLTNYKDRYAFIAGFFGVVVSLLSLGTVIRFGEREILTQELTPFYWLSHLPFLGMIDCPIRFPIGTELSIAMLVGILIYGVKTKRVLSGFILGFVLILFCFEYGTWNMPLWRVSVPSVYEQIAKNPDNYTVLELPSGITESKGSFGYDGSIWALHSKQMYWQTIHRRPRLGGYVSRVPSGIYEFYRSEPVISDLFKMTSFNGVWSNRSYSKEDTLRFLDRFNIGYIVLSPNKRQGEFMSVVEGLFGDYIVKEEGKEGYILYKLRRNPHLESSR